MASASTMAAGDMLVGSSTAAIGLPSAKCACYDAATGRKLVVFSGCGDRTVSEAAAVNT